MWVKSLYVYWVFMLRCLLLILACTFPVAVFSATRVEKPVYLYLSPLTQQYLKANGASYYDESLFRWKKYLRGKYKRLYKEIGRIELLGSLEPGVLVLASAQTLDPDEQSAIRRFTDAGGSLLATGATSSRDASGAFIGYAFVESMFKLRVLGQYGANADWFLMPFGDGPMTWALPAGRRMSVGPNPKDLLRVQSDHLAAVFMNWIRTKDEVGPNGAIAYHESNGSRGVYFSFPETVWGFHRLADMNNLLDGTMDWLRREPRVFKSAWPNGKVAAHLIEMDTEFEFYSAPFLADDLDRIGVKGTFYCLTSEAIKYPEIVKKLLARGHEIAYHADVHFGFKSIDPAAQEKRIQTMKDQMRTILGDHVGVATGFRAPTESYDATTESLLRKYGILHHAADPSSSQDRLPFFSVAEPDLSSDRSLVVLPRTQLDDVNFKQLIYGPARVEANLAHDLDMVVMSGSFGLLSVHSQNYIEGGLMRQTLAHYVTKVAALKDRLWIARGDEIAAWWRNREKFKVAQTELGEDVGFSLTVKGTNIAGATVFVTHPTINVAPSVVAQSGSTLKFQIKRIDGFRSAIIFDKLDAGEYAFIVTFTPAPM